MNDRNITWQEQDDSILTMSPMELLQYSTELSSNRPQGEPWVAVVKPTTIEHKSYIISLSLDAYHVFSEGILNEFINECRKLLALCSDNEIEEMKNEEIKKGNSGELYKVNEGLLRLIVPSRLLNQSKRAIESIFQSVAGNVFNKKMSD